MKNKVQDIHKGGNGKTPAALHVNKGIQTSGLSGVALLFVCVSIGYANYVVFFGTEGWVGKLMLIPSTLFLAYFLVIKAIK